MQNQVETYKEISLRELCSYLRRHITTIIVVSLLGLLLGGGFAMIQKDGNYTAVTQITLMFNEDADEAVLQSVAHMARVREAYITFVGGDLIREHAEENLGYELEEADITKIVALPNGSSNLLIQVYGNQSQKLEEVSDAVNEAILAYAPEISPIVKAVVVKKTVIDSNRTEAYKLALIGTVIAFALAILILVIRLLFNPRFVGAQDPRRLMGKSPMNYTDTKDWNETSARWIRYQLPDNGPSLIGIIDVESKKERSTLGSHLEMIYKDEGVGVKKCESVTQGIALKEQMTKDIVIASAVWESNDPEGLLLIKEADHIIIAIKEDCTRRQTVGEIVAALENWAPDAWGYTYLRD